MLLAGTNQSQSGLTLAATRAPLEGARNGKLAKLLLLINQCSEAQAIHRPSRFRITVRAVSAVIHSETDKDMHSMKKSSITRPLLIVVALLVGLLMTALAVTADDAALPKHLLQPTQVETITAEQFSSVLSTHKGKVVLVNLWATWCVPCVQELPEIDLLQKRYKDQGLEVLAVSFDKASILESRVRPFFAKTAPNLVSYLQAEDDQFDFVSIFDPEWLGGLPTTFFIDRDGELADSFVGKLKYQDMESRVLKLLEQPAAD